MDAFDPLFRTLHSLLPADLRRGLRRAIDQAGRRLPAPLARRFDYSLRRLQEKVRFAADADVSALPPIHIYWANVHLRPMLEGFGFATHEAFFVQTIRQTGRSSDTQHILSLGAGNCDNEVRIAEALIEQGHAEFVIHCLDLVPAMLARGKALAASRGVAGHLRFRVADFNSWVPDQRFDVVMANQCLHHVVELEDLFGRIASMLQAQGRLVISDMIGRNGHQRWPEARAIVDRFWAELPPSYRFHRQLQRQEDHFLDWDCSVSGFEGIRSQDILPLLAEHFHFETFVGYGNVIDPFVDRGFGGNFNADAAWDRDFIDRVHAADMDGLTSGALTPTHMMAACALQPVPMRVCWPERGPAQCIRRGDRPV